MLYRFIIFTSLALLPFYAYSGNFYKCESSSGKVTFSDKPCPKKSKTTKKGKLNSFRISGTVGNKEFPDDKPNRDANSIYIFRAKFSNIQASLMPLRMAITQFYMSRRQWPETMETLGFERQAMQSKQISGVRIKKNGKIVATLNARLGEHKFIILNPSPAMGATTIDWQCWSNFPRTMLGGGELELCESREIY